MDILLGFRGKKEIRVPGVRVAGEEGGLEQTGWIQDGERTQSWAE